MEAEQIQKKIESPKPSIRLHQHHFLHHHRRHHPSHYGLFAVSSASTVKLKGQNPKLVSFTGNLLSALDPKPSVVPPPIPSTHPHPHPVSSSASDGQFMVVAEPADFVHIYSTKVDYKVRQEIDFFREISGVSMSPDDESLYIGIWDRTIWREKPAR